MARDTFLSTFNAIRDYCLNKGELTMTNINVANLWSNPYNANDTPNLIKTLLMKNEIW